MVAAYNVAINKLTESFALRDEAKKILHEAFVEKGNYVSSFFPYEFRAHSLENIKQNITQCAWRRIVDLLELPLFLTQKRKDELYEQIEKNKTPEFTEENILSFCNNVYTGMGNIFDDLLQETFNWLRPRGWQRQYKTNDPYEVGEKVIKEYGIVDTSYGLVRLHYDYGESSLQNLDNVFHLLDGKGIAKPPQNAVTIVKEAIRNKQWKAETEYFSFKWYKKGSFHIKFKRLDLLQKFNARAGAGQLKGEKKDDQPE